VGSDCISRQKATKQAGDGKHLRDGFRWYGSEFYAPVWQAGGDFITEVNGKPEIRIDSAESREGLEFIQKLITEYQITSSDSKAANGNKWGIEFGTASMEVRAEGHIRKLRDEYNIDLGVGPAISKRQTAELVFINKWAISTQANNPLTAWKWIEFVSQREVVSSIQFATAGLPPRRSVSQLDPWARDANYRAVFEAMAYVRPLPGAKYTGAADIRTAIIDVIKTISAGTTSVPAAIDKAKQALTVILAKE
jgi:ABC-type glycerol-3-phosphate transport system substrate-binding protein